MYEIGSWLAQVGDFFFFTNNLRNNEQNSYSEMETKVVNYYFVLIFFQGEIFLIPTQLNEILLFINYLMSCFRLSSTYVSYFK